MHDVPFDDDQNDHYDAAREHCEDQYDNWGAAAGLGITAFGAPLLGGLTAFGAHLQGELACDDSERPEGHGPSFIDGKIGPIPPPETAPPEPHEADPHHDLDFRASAGSDERFDYAAAEAGSTSGGFDYEAALANNDLGFGGGSSGGGGFDGGDTGGSDDA